MFKIDKDKNEAISLDKKTFKDLEFKEVAHLQEWIDKNTDILGEKLLIIQKEFDGFDDTNERLDLLALDKHGDLVIIENKLDDSGKDVTWQALKYVSYCSSLSKNDIKDIYQKYLNRRFMNEDAEKNILDFLNEADFEEIKLNSGDQRIILVAASFRKEVTSTVMWLMNHNVNIKCIKVTPFKFDKDIFLDTEQIIPIKDIEDLVIKINMKKQDEYKTDEETALRHTVRYKFWSKAIPRLYNVTELYRNISPTKENWISGAVGYSGLTYNCVVTKKLSRVEIYIGRSDKELNKKIFDFLFSKKDEIETVFGNKLNWERMDENTTSKIFFSIQDLNVFDEEDWDNIIDFFCINIVKLKEAFDKQVGIIMKEYK